MLKLQSRVGQILEHNFNGYLISGIVKKSQYITTAYESYDYPNNSYDVWWHWIKILNSGNKVDIGKTRKWKEYGYAPFDKCVKSYPIGLWQWSIVNGN